MSAPCTNCGSQTEFVPGHDDGTDADGNRGRDIPATVQCTNESCLHVERVVRDAD